MWKLRDSHEDEKRVDIWEQRSGEHEDMEGLIEDLSSPNPAVRKRSRMALVAMGAGVAPILSSALNHPRDIVRWEAAKGLEEMGHPSAADSLVRALENNDPVVRWIAARGLIVLRENGLQPLLHALVSRPESPWLRLGAHHVLRELAEKGLEDDVRPVLKALDSMEPVLHVPVAAFRALTRLDQAA